MSLQLYATKKIASTFSLPPVPRQTVRRKCACGGTPGPTGECAACRRKRLQRQQVALTKQQEPSLGFASKPEVATASSQAFDLSNSLAREARLAYNFGRLRLQASSSMPDQDRRLHGLPVQLKSDQFEVGSGQENRLIEARCPLEGGCPEETLVDHQGSGRTWCDTASGTMRTTLTEHCAGDCVAQHEAVHRRDREDCCEGVKRCLDNASDAAGRQDCIDTFNAWFPKLSDWTECNAYSREVTCLTNLIRTSCGDGGSAGEECCDTLGDELAFATRQKTAHCAAAEFEPCPFTEPEDFGPGDYPLPAPDAPRYA
jgi:hypothetical protein